MRSPDTVARLGGDEFVILLSPVADMDECEQIASQILETIAQPVALGENQGFVTGSMGITVYPLDDGDNEQLLRHADHAMYQAKQNGRNRYVISNKLSDLDTA